MVLSTIKTIPEHGKERVRQWLGQVDTILDIILSNMF